MTAYKDGLIKSKLLSCSFEHFSLIGVTSNETIYLNLTFLADSMGSGCCLHVILRVPIRIIDNDHICACEIDTHTTSFGR